MPLITWYKDNKLVDMNSDKFHQKVDGSLMLVNIKHGIGNHVGSYYCNVSNIYGDVKSKVSIVKVICK